MFRPRINNVSSSNPSLSRGISRIARSNAPPKKDRNLATTPHPDVEAYHSPASVGEPSHAAEFAQMAKDIPIQHRNVHHPKEPSPVATDMDLKVPKMFRSFAGLDPNDDQSHVQPGHKQSVYTSTPNGPQYVDEAEYKSQKRAETIALSDPPQSMVDKHPRSHKISHNEVDDAKNLQSHTLPRDVHAPSMSFKETASSAAQRVEDDHNLEGRNMGNVLGGYKATLSNPNSTEEARQHARQVLEQYGALPDEYATHGTQYANQTSSGAHYANQTGSANTNNVMGGYKATINNPNTSNGAKEHAQQVLHGMNPRNQPIRSTNGETYGNTGHHATIPQISPDAQQYAQQVLSSVGIDVHGATAAHHQNNLHGSTNNVIGGYKATISNPDTSMEAKKHAQEVLNRNGVDNRASNVQYEDATRSNPNNVLGGHKATMSNPNTTHEAKQHAQEMLNRNRVDMQADGTQNARTNIPYNLQPNTAHANTNAYSGNANQFTEYQSKNSIPASERDHMNQAADTLHRGAPEVNGRISDISNEDVPRTPQGGTVRNVVGGYKATITNPNTSMDAKNHAQQVLNQTETPYHQGGTGHIMGGYKATINNPKSSAEAKQHASQMLEKMESEGAVGVESMTETSVDSLRGPRSKVATDMDLKVPNILKSFAGMKGDQVQNQEKGDVYKMEYKTTANGPQYVHKDAHQGSNMARAAEEDQSEMLMEEDPNQNGNQKNQKGKAMRK